MIKKQTNKLFWDKYAYKLGVYNSGTHIFRNKRLDNARVIIDQLQRKSSQGMHLTFKMHRWSQKEQEIRSEDFDDLKILVNAFQDDVDFMLRCEGSRLGIYSNDIDWLKKISRKINDVPWLWEPTVKNLEKNTIYLDKPSDYDYKINLNGTADKNFADYCLKNITKVKAGDRLIKDLQQGRDLKGKYLYVKDEKILTIVRLFLHNNIMRIDRLVYKDK